MKLNLLILVLLLITAPTYSQGFLKKAKAKVNQGSKILRDIKGDDAKENDANNSDEDYDEDDMSNPRNGRPSNTKGKKLSASSIDVEEQIINAEAGLTGKDYGQARKSIEQALLGIEVAMAYKILESLPQQVDELKADENTDHVAASGAGYSGLTLEREYYAEPTESDNSEGERYMKFSLVNSSLYVSGITTYISNPVYSSTDEGDKKVIQYKGVNSLLEYSDYEGYKLSVPIGENTLVQYTCVNFEDETEVIAAADLFDMEKIKIYLGEK